MGKLLRTKLRRLLRPLRRQQMLMTRLPLNDVHKAGYYFFAVIGAGFCGLVAIGGVLWILNELFAISPGFNLMELIVAGACMWSMLPLIFCLEPLYRAWKLDTLAGREKCVFCGYKVRGLPPAKKLPGFHNCPECGGIIVTSPYGRPEDGQFVRKEAEEAVIAVKNYRKRHTVPVSTIKVLLLSSVLGSFIMSAALCFMIILDKYYLPGFLSEPMPVDLPDLPFKIMGTVVCGVPLLFLAIPMIMGLPVLFRALSLRGLIPLLRKEVYELFLELEERHERGIGLPEFREEKKERRTSRKKIPVTA